MNFDSILEKANELVAAYGMKVVSALVVLIIGSMVVRGLTGAFRKVLEKRDIDDTLKPFLVGIINALLKVILFVSVLQILGIQLTSLVAILASAGFAIGLALSGNLQNFAGGVMLLILKPIRKGDWIEAQGYAGTVESIQIFVTVLKTPDNKTIFIPNGPLSSGPMINYSLEERRRVDLTFGIGYDDDFEKARGVIMDIVNADERILKNPEPFVKVGALADSSVNFTVRLWVNAADYWGVHFDMHEQVKTQFDANRISIPYPQTDVHVHNAK